MRKLILFFTAISLGFAMTSCLDGGSQNFTESSVVYIAMDQNLVYGKTLTGRLITSDNIKMMTPGKFKFLSYSWDESYGYTALGSASVYNVVSSADAIDITPTVLQMVPVSESTPNLPLKELKDPAYDPKGEYIDDFWLFQYSYMGKEGEIPVVTFHKRNSTEENPDPVQIDVRFSKTGEPKAGATEKMVTDIIAVNMLPLRLMYEGSSSTVTKDLRVKFYYNLDGRTEPVETQTYTMKVKGN